MRRWLDDIMNRRARGLAGRLQPWLPEGSRVADIGSGTGHNAANWRELLHVSVDEFDVADLHWVGDGPTLFDGRNLSVANATYDVVTLLFVLQYSPHVRELLAEAHRISRGRVLLIQSTCQGRWGRMWLRLREFCWGPLAFHVAGFVGAIRGQPCPLNARRQFSLDELRTLFQQSGFRICHWQPRPWPGLRVSRDLFVLEPIRH